MVRKPVVPITWDLRAAFASAFPLAADTDTGTGTGGDADAGTDDDTGKDDAGDTGAGDDTGSDVKDPEKKQLSDEAAKHRLKAKAEKDRADQLAAELKTLQDKEKSELDKAQRDLAELKPKLDEALATIKAQAIKIAFFDSGAAKQFKNTTLVLKNLDLDGIEVDDENNVDAKAIKAKADAFLKEHPYLAADGDDSGSAGGDAASGRPNNGKKDTSKVDYEALARKFPALRR